MKLAEIAAQINAHLKRLQADEAWNRRDRVDRDGRRKVYSVLQSVNASQAGRYVGVTYVSYQGRTNLTKAEALAYLEWLDDGNKGRHFEQQRETTP